MRFLIDIIAGKGDDHRTLFLRNELAALFGKKEKNLKTLFYFCLMAYFAITFAQSGLVYLKYRMDNPFINWLTFPVSADIDARYDLILHTLDDYKENDTYYLDNVNGFHRYSLIFRNLKGKELDRVKGRTMAFPQDSLLLKSVLSGDNLISPEGVEKDPQKWTDRQLKNGVILTEELYDQISCELEKTAYASINDYFLELEVIAVVRSLPDRALFMSSYEMYWGLVRSSAAAMDIFRYPNTNVMEFLVTDLQKGNDLSSVTQTLPSHVLENVGVKVESVTIEENQGSCIYGKRLLLHMEDKPSEGQYNALYKYIGKELQSYHPFLVEEYDMYRFGALGTTDDDLFKSGTKGIPYSSITLHFNKVDSIRQFRQLMLKELDVDINLEQIEARENFHLVSILTNILALALMLFTMISITIFISNILNSHLEKIKMNLGTFMAFGLSREFLISGYTRLILGMLVVVSVFVLLILMVIDLLNIPYHLLDWLGMNLKPDFKEAFSIWNYGLFFLISLILFFTWRRCRSLVSSFIRHFPSDLIYNRT